MSLRETAGFDGGSGSSAPARTALEQVRLLLRGQDDRARTQRSALVALLIRVTGAGLAYISQALLARWMGSFEYGIFVFVWVWVLILGGLAPLGLSTAAIRFVAEYRETDRPELLRGLLRGSRMVAAGVSTLVMVCALAGLALFGDLLESYYLLPAFLILFCLPVYSVVDVQDGISRGYGWMDLALAPPYIIRPILLLAAMAAAALAGLPLTAVTAAGCAVFAYWVSGIMQTVVMQRRIVREMPAGPRSYQTTLWLKTSLPLLLVLCFDLLLQNTDILVLSRYMSPSDVAVYFAALKTIGLMSFVHFAVGTAAANRFSAYKAKGDHDQLAQTVRDTVRWTFWPSLGAAVLLLALGKPLLWLFGPEFTAGYPVMFVLAAGFLIRAAIGPAELVLNMLGEQNRCALVLSGSALLNLALNFALIPPYGMFGAAIATSVSIAIAAIAFLFVAKKRLGLNLLVWQRG